MDVKYPRTPYKVTYWKDGEKHVIQRRPPPKLHDIEPEDTVTLTRGKNDDFPKGSELTVKGISPRQPNVLQLVNEEGLATFVDYYDAELEEMRGKRNGVDPLDFPINNKYLLWP